VARASNAFRSHPLLQPTRHGILAATRSTFYFGMRGHFGVEFHL
jgi:hypothetical protein